MPQKTSDQLKTHRYFAADYPLLFTEITAKDYVSFAHSLYQKDFSEQQFASLAEAFHFSKYINRRISELSLGNRQKIVLMTGLLLRAPLFILDEPLVGLDVESIEVFYQKMREYCEAGGPFCFLLICSMSCKDFVITRPFFTTNRSKRSFRLERRSICGGNFSR